MSVRGLTGYPQQGFGRGLDLLSKPDNVDPASCIDALDVLFSDRGAIQQRPGYAQLTSPQPLTNPVGSLEAFYTSSGTRQLLAGCGTRLEALSTAGAVVDSETGLTNAVWDFARFGKPNAEVAYAGNGTDTLRKWNGSEWTAPTATVNAEGVKAMPKAGSLCVWPSGGNRLVATRFSTTTGGPGGAISSPDHVWFSDPGDPESWHTTEPEENQVQLMPGNGEPIQACIAWKEFVFVFKETSFFVFYAVGSDAEGGPEFLFRPVDAGVGLVAPRALCIHPTGVYFMARNGVYRTTGQEPELISSAVEPIWSGEASPFYTGGTLATGSIANCAMGTWEDRIYLAFPTSEANSRVLVYDPNFEWWSLYSLPASCFTSFRVGSREELVFGYASGANKVGRHSSSYTNDDGAAISSRWRSGWFDLDNPDRKTIRESKVWGTGVVEMGLDSDFIINAGSTVELDMTGTTGSPIGGEGFIGGEGLIGDIANALIGTQRRVAERGTTFSMFFFNSTLDQSWSMHRVDNLLREISKPSTINP
jgi:hypothetical protein